VLKFSLLDFKKMKANFQKMKVIFSKMEAIFFICQFKKNFLTKKPGKGRD